MAKMKQLQTNIGGLSVLVDLGIVYNIRTRVGKRFAIFLCDCGKEFQADYSAVKRGNTKSCGCRNHKHHTHGLYYTRLYRIWIGIKGRCNNPKKKVLQRLWWQGNKYVPGME